ncbi:unnamed protein product [Schistosoma mattheei]|uniref:Uncharacterized protein n=1 Tax=Schistosoma mattheei TaxID=31246 RepID=A0A3P8FS25_9TREM|nr:unnamed protein product [Schistosoma mattheei]
MSWIRFAIKHKTYDPSSLDSRILNSSELSYNVMMILEHNLSFTIISYASFIMEFICSINPGTVKIFLVNEITSF